MGREDVFNNSAAACHCPGMTKLSHEESLFPEKVMLDQCFLGHVGTVALIDSAN